MLLDEPLKTQIKYRNSESKLDELIVGDVAGEGKADKDKHIWNMKTRGWKINAQHVV